MKFSLDKPRSRSEQASSSSPRARMPLPGENTKARVDNTGTSASAYLKTALKAKEAGNHRREADLIEKAILAMGHKSPIVVRRYAAALYRAGEYRAAWVIITDPVAARDGGEDYVARLKDSLASRDVDGFTEILDFS